VAGFFGAKALRLPAAAVVGPMVLSAALHVAGWTEARPPVELVAAAQVVIGTSIGCRFAGVGIALIGRTVVLAAGSTVILIAVNLAFAFALNAATDLPITALVLAFAPGGLAEMSLIALALSFDAAFVATHHIVRIFLIVVLAPAAFRARERRGDGA
jgi:membrane AbrB-like protein